MADRAQARATRVSEAENALAARRSAADTARLFADEETTMMLISRLGLRAR